MAFLDKKTRVIDMQLTARGRELLATSQLTIQFYAFSDEMIDYSGSLAQSLATAEPLDEIVYRNFVPMQADQMNQNGLSRDLTSFLYTAPEQRDVLPQMQVQMTSLTLQRNYSEQTYTSFVNDTLNTGTGRFVTMINLKDAPADERETQYLEEQNLEKLEQQLPEIVTLARR